jgi:hypothetical protein
MRARRPALAAIALAYSLLMVGCGGGGGGGSSSTSTSTSTSSTGSGTPTTAANSLVATPTDASVKAVVGASAAVAVVFTTNNGVPVSNVQVDNLTQLPAGWTASTSAFSCTQAATGNGCMLNLKYQPTAVTSGSVPLAYAYNDDAGVAKSGSVTIPYAATSMDNAVASVSTVGQITVAALSAPQPVMVTFTTDDGNQATNLQIISGLSALPAGWSGAGAFSCATFASGSGCQLGLAFAPTTTTAGTITLGYSYADNSGAPKTGTVSIPYLSTGDNNVVASTTPGGQVVGLVNSGSQSVTVTFVTDNTQAATNFSVTTSLAGLPTGWTSAANSLSCGSVTTGTGCQLQLSYAPTAATSGTLAIGYSFTSTTGDTKIATASIPYTTAPGHTYIADFGGNQILECAMSASSGALSGCVSILSVASPRSVTFNGAYAYVTSYVSSTTSLNPLFVCPVNPDGTFGSCTATGATAGLSYPSGVVFNGGFVYIPEHGGMVATCTLDGSGLPTGCASNATFATTTTFNAPTSIVFRGGSAYVADQWAVNGTVAGTLFVCGVDGTTGALTSCAPSTSFQSQNPVALAAVGAYLYVGTDESTSLCALNTDNSVGACAATSPAVGSLALPVGATSTSDYGVVTVNGYFYVGDHANGIVWICPAAANGAIGSCSAAGISVNSPTGITIN